MTVPSVFGLPHLSEDAVAAFADGVLSPAASARAQRHCAACAECSEAVRGQREAAMMLRTAAVPQLPSGLLDRLAGVPMSAPLEPPSSGLPTVLGADGVPMFVSHNPSARSSRSIVEQPEAEPEQTGHDTTHTARRGTLPLGLLASAAAVVAAGTLGAHAQTLAAAGRQSDIPTSTIAGAFTGGQTNIAPASQTRLAGPAAADAMTANLMAQSMLAGRTESAATQPVRLGTGALLDVPQTLAGGSFITMP
ncbi:MAG TPA: hypothetical protein VGH11_15090 [Jatrophihabitans sp.]|jgi:hypothetical protein